MKKKIIQTAFRHTLPILAGYLVLGAGFGMLLSAAGYGPVWALGIAMVMYSGSMQYAAVSLIAGNASIPTVIVTTLAVQARHLFYGISLVDRYRGAGWRKFMMVFGLTDETYSLVVMGDKGHDYCFYVSLFDYCYWICGCVLGAVMGQILPINSEGIDFSLTALFLVVFTDQWMGSKEHFSALTGLAISFGCLLIFGADAFLVPAMIGITLGLLVMRRSREEAEQQ